MCVGMKVRKYIEENKHVIRVSRRYIYFCETTNTRKNNNNGSFLEKTTATSNNSLL